MVTPAARREAVAHLRASLGVSERRACGIIGTDRTSIRYRSQRGDDAALRGRLRELARQRRRFGYRRLHILLLREGVRVNRKKTQRLYTEEGLTVRKRKSRRRPRAAAGACPAERAVVARLRARPARGRQAVPDAERHGRRHARVPGGGRGHVDLGQAGGALKRPEFRGGSFV